MRKLITAVFIFSLFNLFFVCKTNGQAIVDTLYTGFDPISFNGVNPQPYQAVLKKGRYIQLKKNKAGIASKIKFIEAWKDSSSRSRSATLRKTKEGTLISFERLKTPGYEKVLIFADMDFYYDTLLIVNDTLYFKEMSDDHVELKIVYPSVNDTVRVWEANRNTRLDFLADKKFNPAMQNFRAWTSAADLDKEDNFVLLKKGDVYEVLFVETSRKDISEYDAKRMKSKYEQPGLTRFWIALDGVYY